MKLEDRLKELILQRYRSIREFTQVIDMSYSTMDSILKRGLDNASISNVIKICKALNISADELANGRLVPSDKVMQRRTNMTEIDDIIRYTKTNIMDYEGLTIGGQPLTEEDAESLIDALDIAVALIKRKRDRRGN